MNKKNDHLPLEYQGTTQIRSDTNRQSSFMGISLSESEVHQKLIAKRKFGFFGEPN